MHRQSKIILTTTSVILACGVWAGLAEQHRRAVREFDELQKHQLDGRLPDPAAPETARRAPELPDTIFSDPSDRIPAEEYRRQARKDEDDMILYEAETNCSAEKRKSGAYHSASAPSLECRAEAEEMGRAEFARRYGERIEADSTRPPALPSPVPSERPKPLRQPGLSGPIV